MKKPTKTAVKPAAKATAVSTKRPRTYKKSDLPRTARAYLGKTYSIHLLKENEAVARLIELHEEKKLVHEEIRKQQADRYVNRFSDPARNAFGQTITVSRDHTSFNEENLEAILKDLQLKKLTLREQFLAWIGVKNG